MKVINYLSDFPFSLGYGGKEVQLLTYINIYTDKDLYGVHRLDYWDKEALLNSDAIHLYGYSGWYAQIINSVRIKYPKIKIVISPNFYRKNFFFYKFTFHIFKYFPLRNYFNLLNKIITNVDLIIVNSESEKLQLLSLNKDVKVNVIQNGIEDDYEIFQYTPDFDISILDDGFILSVGFFDERKNTLNMLKAFLKTYIKHKNKLVLVGENRFTNAGDRDEFDNILKCNKDIILNFGFINRNDSKLKFLYSKCQIHILPSHLETPGLTTLEALAFSKNVVVGECEPIKEYLSSIPYYCNPNSIEDISRAVIEALNNSKKTLSKLPNELRFSNLAKKLNDSYKDILTG